MTDIRNLELNEIDRMITKDGRVIRVEDSGLVSQDPHGESRYRLIADQESRQSNEAFREFLQEGEGTIVDSSSPDYKTYIIWNLTRDTHYIKQVGVTYIPEEKKDYYRYEDHYNFLTQLLGSEESKKIAGAYTRDRLLERFAAGEDHMSVSLNYNIRGTWSRVRSNFHMMEEPVSGDVYLKIQNYNTVNSDVYESMFEATIRDIYDSILYMNFELDGLVVTDEMRADSIRRSQQVLSDSMDEINVRTGLTCKTKDDLEVLLKERIASEEERKWTFETDGRYYHVKAQKADQERSIYALGIIDVTREILSTRERDLQDYRNKAMLAALAVEYVTITELDVESGQLTPFKVHEASLPQVNAAMESGDYERVRRTMIETSVDAQDRTEFARQMDLSYLKERLQSVPNYRFIYRSSFNTYIEVKVVRADQSMEGEPKHVIIGFADKDQVTREKLASERDRLTGLYNRSKYEQTLKDLQADHYETICVVGMDVNGLKRVNDNLGHLEGDALIRGAAQCILDTFRDLGTCFRIGGDEFEVIILDQDCSEAELRAELKSRTAAWKGNYDEGLHISVGFAKADASEGKSIDELIKEADNEMYADKRLFYSKQGNERRSKDQNITKSEMANRIAELRTMFDEVRMVDLDMKRAVRYDEKGEEYQEHLHCFEIWGKQAACENCVSALAMADHGKHSKFEKRADGIYMVTSRYVSVDGRPVLLEVITRLDDTDVIDM